jgi:hypothetical protein
LRRVPPGIDAGEGELLMRVELLAHAGVDPVAGDGDGTPRWLEGAAGRRFNEAHHHPGGVLFYPHALVIHQNAFVPQPCNGRIIKNSMQAPAMDPHFRVGVAREHPSLFSVDELAEAIEKTAFAILDARVQQLLLQPERCELSHRVREQGDPDTEFLDFLGTLVDAARNSALVQIHGQDQPANAAAYDEHLHLHLLGARRRRVRAARVPGSRVSVSRRRLVPAKHCAIPNNPGIRRQRISPLLGLELPVGHP